MSASSSTTKDVSRAKELINYRWFQKKDWQDEIKRMLASGLKYELDALATRLPLPVQDLSSEEAQGERDWLD